MLLRIRPGHILRRAAIGFAVIGGGFAGQALAQEGGSVTIITNTLPAKLAQQEEQEIEVTIGNPTSRRMTVHVVYMPTEETDLVADPDDETESPWKLKTVVLDGGETRGDTGVSTKHKTLYYIAAEEQGLHVGEDADTPKLRISGREYPTRAVSLGAKRGFSVSSKKPNVTREEMREEAAEDRFEKDLAKQPLAASILGLVVEKTRRGGLTVFKIEKIIPDKAADSNNLNVGDTVDALNGRQFAPDDSLEDRLRRLAKLGKPFTLTIRTEEGPKNVVFDPGGQAIAGLPADARPVDLGPPTFGVVVKDYVDPQGRFAGAEIVAIRKGSPAEEKEMSVGNVITELFEEPVRSKATFLRLEKRFEAGLEVPFSYYSARNDRILKDTVTFPVEVREAALRRFSIGLTVRNNPRGYVVITDVSPNSPLDGIVEVNDLIIELDDIPVRSKTDFDRAEAAIRPGREDVPITYFDARRKERVMRRFTSPGG